MTALKGGRAKRKVSLAIGGWNDSKGDKYSRLVNDPKARRYVPRIYLLEDCYSSSQSAPTFLVYQVDLIFFEGLDLEKAGCKKQGHCYSKREEARRFSGCRLTGQLSREHLVSILVHASLTNAAW